MLFLVIHKSTCNFDFSWHWNTGALPQQRRGKLKTLLSQNRGLCFIETHNGLHGERTLTSQFCAKHMKNVKTQFFLIQVICKTWVHAWHIKATIVRKVIVEKKTLYKSSPRPIWSMPSPRSKATPSISCSSTSPCRMSNEWRPSSWPMISRIVCRSSCWRERKISMIRTPRSARISRIASKTRTSLPRYWAQSDAESSYPRTMFQTEDLFPPAQLGSQDYFGLTQRRHGP